MSLIVNTAKRDMLLAQWNWTGDTIKVMLVDSGYTPDADHDFVADVVANELSGTGYVDGFGNAGRQVLAGKTATADLANDRAEFDANNVVWSGINAGTIGAAVVMKEVTNDADSPILAIITSADFPLVTNGGDVTLKWDATGVLRIE